MLNSETERFQLLVQVAPGCGYVNKVYVKLREIWHTLSLQIHLVIKYQVSSTFLWTNKKQ